jgi:hypothetical protein
VEDWVRRALAKWPDVPALYGWLSLDRRGRWRIRGETISRPQIVDTINRNYEADAQGRWYFQNGPQRGYMQLEYAPLILRADSPENLTTHTGLAVKAPRAAYLDEDGAVVIDTEHGPGIVDDQDLDWILQRLRADGRPLDDGALAAALALPSGATTALQLQIDDLVLPVQRLDAADVPARLGFVRDPKPDPAAH